MDMLAAGAAWLTERLSESASRTVTYLRGSTSSSLVATIARSTFEAANQSGVVETWESRDFLIAAGTLPYAEPARGDRIVDGGTTYEVVTPRGVPLWHWADAFRTAIRIHTVATSNAPPPVGTLLARAVGGSASTAITDAAILSSLFVDLAAGRTLSRSLTLSAEYVYLVLPTSFGTPVIKVNGLVSNSWQTTSRSITFSGQASRSYTVWRSTYAVSGTALVEVT